MKTYGILGILWLIFGCFEAYANIRGILFVMPLPAHVDSIVLHYLWLHGSILLLNFVVIMAGLFLARGDDWARWFLGMYAIICLIAAIARAGISFSIVYVVFGIFALISAVLLLKPRQDDAI